MRIDKFLKVSRLLKRRTVANEAVKGGDVAEIRFGDETVKFRVLSLNPVVRKDDASALYEIIS